MVSLMKDFILILTIINQYNTSMNNLIVDNFQIGACACFVHHLTMYLNYV